MSSAKLKVDELRAELERRDLNTSGTKPTLVRRLDAAIRKEKKAAEQKDIAAAAAAAAPAPVPDPEDDASKDDGAATNGGKKRRRGQSEDIPQDEDEDKDAQDSKKDKVVTVTKKNGAILDQYLSDHIKSGFHVLQKGEDIYSAMLNQTNVGDNNNKFYVIQALESDDGRQFMVYNRWGRVGVKGQEKMQHCISSEAAIQEFDQKFYSKTKNWWYQRKDFKSYPKLYTWLEMDYGDAEDENSKSNKSESSIAKPQETKLEPRIAKFISLICNMSMMKQQMMEIGFNAEKLPLGKLSKSTISKGYDVLRRISEVISRPNRRRLEELSGEFYTVIPHDFGFKKMGEFVIDTPGKLKSKLEMVEALAEIEVATKILKDEVAQDDPLKSRYEQLQCTLVPIEVDTEEHSMIHKYVVNTHGKTHSNYAVDIVQIFKVSRQDELEGFKKFSSTKNRMLLWHGSRLTNWTGILSQGLRIAPPEAPVTGYMFGKGVYFADMFSKSANYCYASKHLSDGVMLLCEVALGDMAELQSANYNANKLPKGKLSTKGVGGTAPDMSEAQALEDGVIVPLGTPKQQNNDGQYCSLLYNEYIVYNVEQIRMRYLVHVNFKFEY